jgi:D-xylulose 5-phosphate/D-fructose 6-phosphate phosphoketolase-like protein
MIRGAETAIVRLYPTLIANALDYARTTVIVRIDVDGRRARAPVRRRPMPRPGAGGPRPGRRQADVRLAVREAGIPAGRWHGMFATYEAFEMVSASMLVQHTKWLQHAADLPWRVPAAPLTRAGTTRLADDYRTATTRGL